MSNWTSSYIDSQAGKTFIVTGGTSGIGLETVKELLKNHGQVIIGGDDEKKGQAVVKELRGQFPGEKVTFGPLDLSSLSSIYGFVNRIIQEHPTIDVLINNAGISTIPSRMESADGHELIFATNYLGHFVLTSQLFPLLLRAHDPRVVCVSSLRHKAGELNFQDLDYHRGYDAEAAYARSKLAILMFSLELHRRCLNNGINLKSIPVHPGAVSTEIFDRGPKIAGQYFHPLPVIKRVLIKSLGQEAKKGALPVLFATTSLEARSGVYYGPHGLGELWGNPTEARIAVHAENMLSSARLWEESEKLSGVRFDVGSSRTIGLH